MLTAAVATSRCAASANTGQMSSSLCGPAITKHDISTNWTVSRCEPLRRMETCDTHQIR